LSQRDSIDRVMARLRPELAQVPGGRLFLIPMQDLRVGGRQSMRNTNTPLQSENVQDLYTWTPKLVDALARKFGPDRRQRGSAATRPGDIS